MAERKPREVFPEVYLVGGAELTRASDCLIYAVDGGTELALVDCGAGMGTPKSCFPTWRRWVSGANP